MATRAWLNDVLPGSTAACGQTVRAESVGGVDAARRVRAGEAFDVVFLASDAIDALMADGWLQAGSRVDLVRSEVSVAVRDGTPEPRLADAADVRAAVLAAPTVGYSTGPSGTQLLRQLDAWGLRETLGDRLVQAPPGIPVARLLAEGTVALGFQQTSELIHTPGVRVVGALPPDCAISTVFSGAVGSHAQDAAGAAALLAWLASDALADSKRRQGLEPA
jgi:molybdate transport system substrate-binding protein